jgi:hypothetical protein
MSRPSTLRVFSVESPPQRIRRDVLAESSELFFISDHTVVIAALPEGRASESARSTLEEPDHRRDRDAVRIPVDQDPVQVVGHHDE